MYWWYKTSRPIKAKGGIKAQGGKFGESWWSSKWIKALESYSYEWCSRLQRGRRYATGGQVLDYSIKRGVVRAKVQGSMSEPYSIKIKLKAISDNDWEKVIRRMSSKAIFLAKLLSGEMPENIEHAFRSAGVALFPKSPREIKAECTCPDIANPCKHIAAVYYILAEEFDRNPFMLFEIRGRDRSRLLLELRGKRMNKPEPVQKAAVAKKKAAPKRKISKKLDFDSFWKMGSRMKGFSVSIDKPQVELSILKRLGAPSFWKLKMDFMKEMSGIYELVSERSVEIANEDRHYAK